MKVVVHEQGSEKWLNWRLSGVGASEISALANTNPYIAGPNELFQYKTGRKPKKTIAKQAQAHGDFAEIAGLEEANKALNTKFVPLCVEDDDNPFLKVSLDGWSEDGIILECKAVSSEVYDNIESAGETGVPLHILDQIYYQMSVTKCDEAYLYCQQNKTGRRHLTKIAPNRTRQAQLIALALKFQKNIESDTAPELGPNEYVDLTHSKWKDDAELILNLTGKKKDLETQVKRLKAQIEEKTSHLVDETKRKKLKFGQLRVSVIERKGTIDYSKLMTDNGSINFEEYRKKSSSYIKTSIAKD